MVQAELDIMDLIITLHQSLYQKAVQEAMELHYQSQAHQSCMQQVVEGVVIMLQHLLVVLGAERTLTVRGQCLVGLEALKAQAQGVQ